MARAASALQSAGVGVASDFPTASAEGMPFTGNNFGTRVLQATPRAEPRRG